MGNIPKNILSYELGTVFTGKQIKDWIQYNLDNDTSHKRIACKMKKYLTIKDDVNYKLVKGTYESSASYNEYLVEMVS